MTLAKGNKLFKIGGTSEDVFERFRQFTSKSSYSHRLTEKELAQILCPDETYVEYEVNSDADYRYSPEGFHYVVPHLKVVY